MTEHVVRWEIAVDATTVHEAAEKAREAQLRPDTTATVFDVYTLGQDGNPIPGMPVEVDLSEDDECTCRCNEGRHCGGCGHAGCGYRP